MYQLINNWHIYSNIVASSRGNYNIIHCNVESILSGGGSPGPEHQEEDVINIPEGDLRLYPRGHLRTVFEDRNLSWSLLEWPDQH